MKSVNSASKTGPVYCSFTAPEFGSILYLQYLTALTPFFEATPTIPDSRVGGLWPELGLLLPSSPQSGNPPTDPILARGAARKDRRARDAEARGHRASGRVRSHSSGALRHRVDAHRTGTAGTAVSVRTIWTA